MAHRLTRSRVYVLHLNPLKLTFIILNVFLFKYICLTWASPELRRSPPNVIRPIQSIVDCWVKPKGLFFNLTSLIRLCSNVFHSSQSAFNQASSFCTFITNKGLWAGAVRKNTRKGNPGTPSHFESNHSFSFYSTSTRKSIHVPSRGT